MNSGRPVKSRKTKLYSFALTLLTLWAAMFPQQVNSVAQKATDKNQNSLVSQEIYTTRKTEEKHKKLE